MSPISSDPPLLPGRQEAAEWARRELNSGRYESESSNWIADAVSKLVSKFWSMLDALFSGSNGTGNALTTVIVIAVVTLVVAALVRHARLTTTTRRRDSGVFNGEVPLTAQEHRDRAEAAHRVGDHRTAVIEWFRAIARDLEERTILAPRPGRTADEIANEAAYHLGDETRQLRAAAQTFDMIVYGDLTATAQHSSVLREADEMQRRVPARLG